MTPDRLHLYRSSDGFRWRRRTATGTLTGRAHHGAHRKALMWRACRRANPDWETCRIDDRTFTWTRGGTNLSRPPGQRTPRTLPTIREAQRRL